MPYFVLEFLLVANTPLKGGFCMSKLNWLTLSAEMVFSWKTEDSDDSLNNF